MRDYNPASVTCRLPLEPYRNRQQILGGSIQAPTNGFTLGCKKSRIWKNYHTPHKQSFYMYLKLQQLYLIFTISLINVKMSIIQMSKIVDTCTCIYPSVLPLIYPYTTPHRQFYTFFNTFSTPHRLYFIPLPYLTVRSLPFSTLHCPFPTLLQHLIAYS